jgi:hypothetical protein
MSKRAGASVNVELIKQAKKRNRMLAQEADNDMRAVMATAEGRRLVFRLLERAHIWQGIYAVDNGGRCDTHYSIRLEGERNMGLWLMDQVQQACPHQLLSVLTEGLQRDAQVRREISQIPQPHEGGDDE